MPTRYACIALVFCHLVVVASMCSAEDATSQPPPIYVPDGFVSEKFAGSPLVKYPILGGFDDRGRLFMCENAGVNINKQDLLDNATPNSIRLVPTECIGSPSTQVTLVPLGWRD